MTHEEAYLLMMNALDGVVKPADAERLDEHLTLCADCLNEWRALQLVDGLLASAPMVAAPAGLSQRVQARIDAPSWQRTLGALFALSLGSLGALLLIAVPAGIVLLGMWTVYNEPASFAGVLVWLNQLVRVSGSLLGSLWTTIRLFITELAASPVTFAWMLLAALVAGIWAHMLRRPAFVHVSNGYWVNE
jgi:anti-sigma factor RsiW